MSFGQTMEANTGLTITPGSGTFSIVGVIYLADSSYINVGATVAGITGQLTVQVANPADDLVVAQGSAYSLTSYDLDKFSYAVSGWEFYLDDSENTINLIS